MTTSKRNPRGMRTIALVAFPGVQLLDIAGPADVFAMANVYSVEPFFRVRLVSSAGGTLATSSGMVLQTEGLDAVAPDSVDTLIIAGGERNGLGEAIRDERLAAWTRSACKLARRYGSVCTGAFALAHWGLLDGHRATTHWEGTSLLRRHFSGIEVEPDALYVQDGKVWTSGGVTSGIDMSLALVEQDLGRWIAMRVAKQLILAARRLGNQSQFSATLEAQAGQYAALVDWMRAHLGEPIGVERMAEKAGESPRSFHRHFVKVTGLTPHAFLEALRLQAAKTRLEAGEPLKSVAQASGFRSEAHLAKIFRRRYALTPSQYRALYGE